MEKKGELRQIQKLPPVGDGPIEEWLRAIKARAPPGLQLRLRRPAHRVVLLGALAQRTGRTIEWDAETMQVKGQRISSRSSRSRPGTAGGTARISAEVDLVL